MLTMSRCYWASRELYVIDRLYALLHDVLLCIRIHLPAAVKCFAILLLLQLLLFVTVCRMAKFVAVVHCI